MSELPLLITYSPCLFEPLGPSRYVIHGQYSRVKSRDNATALTLY